MKKAVILLSGGLDSTTCLAVAKQQGYECYTLAFDYGQKHKSELEQSAKISKALGAISHQVINLSLGDLGGSALTDDAIDVPDYAGDDAIPVTYVPARNTVFLSIALGWAEILSADAIFIGVSAVDYSGYPDCRPDYIAAFQAMAKLATRAGIEGRAIEIVTPIIHLSKAETIKLGESLGIDYGITVSCYRGDSCILRKQGFKEAEVTDPTVYVA